MEEYYWECLMLNCDLKKHLSINFTTSIDSWDQFLPIISIIHFLLPSFTWNFKAQKNFRVYLFPTSPGRLMKGWVRSWMLGNGTRLIPRVGARRFGNMNMCAVHVCRDVGGRSRSHHLSTKFPALRYRWLLASGVLPSETRQISVLFHWNIGWIPVFTFIQH